MEKARSAEESEPQPIKYETQASVVHNSLLKSHGILIIDPTRRSSDSLTKIQLIYIYIGYVLRVISYSKWEYPPCGYLSSN